MRPRNDARSTCCNRPRPMWVLSEPPRGGVGVVQLLSQRKIALSLVTPPEHPLLVRRLITLDMIARYPLVQIDPTLSGGWNVKRAFERAGVSPNVVMTAGNIEVVKAYVAHGLGWPSCRRSASRLNTARISINSTLAISFHLCRISSDCIPNRPCAVMSTTSSRHSRRNGRKGG
jgi:DNA-binding transcriptional LysR family regulator